MPAGSVAVDLKGEEVVEKLSVGVFVVVVIVVLQVLDSTEKKSSGK